MKRLVTLVAFALCAACGSAPTTDSTPSSIDEDAVDTTPAVSNARDDDFVARATSTSPSTSPSTRPSTSAAPADTAGPASTDVTTPATTAVPAVTTSPRTTDVTTTIGAPPAPITIETPTDTPPVATGAPPHDPAFLATNGAFDALARTNAAVSLTVRRDGDNVVARASGTTIDGSAATSDSPMVVASVSKIVVNFAVARLAQRGDIDVAAPMPWSSIGIAPHSGWSDVTVRELLDHTSGMPVVRTSWFDGSGDCSTYLPTLIARAPRSHRGSWTYSNGNYCALGLLVEAVSSVSLDVAVQTLLFDPLGVDGVHLTSGGGGLLPGDIAHSNDVARYDRLGGAGTFVISTDDLAALLTSATSADVDTITNPGVIIDQYGWGHTGTVSGAKSCAWSMDAGRTSVAVTVAGDSPGTGGALCDVVVRAVAVDLGLDAGRPDRSPP